MTGRRTDRARHLTPPAAIIVFSSSVHHVVVRERQTRPEAVLVPPGGLRLGLLLSPMSRFISLLLALTLGSPQEQRGAAVTALVGGTIVDVSAFGSSRADVGDAVVIVENGRITAAGPRRSTKVPRGAVIVDVKGKFIVPGLTDAFATVKNQAYANAFLYMGVTSVLANEEADNRRGALFTSGTPSPRILRMKGMSGYDATGLEPPPRTQPELVARARKMSPAELASQVDEFATQGVSLVKINYGMTPDQTRAVAGRARELGLGTIGELGATTYPEAMAAGVRAFVHTSRYSLELAPPDLRARIAAAPFGPPRIPYYEFLSTIKAEDPALARYAATLSHGDVALIPTLSMAYLDLPGHKNPWNEPAAKLLNPADIHLPADPKTGERTPSPIARDQFPPGANEHLLLIEAQYCKAGAPYLAGSGTDAFGTMPGISLHIELELLVRECLTPRQALAASTGNVGTTFLWRDVGQIRAGYHADLLVLDADPAVDIANLKKINRVMLAGTWIDREALLASGK